MPREEGIGDVLLDRVWLSRSYVLNRVEIFVFVKMVQVSDANKYVYVQHFIIYATLHDNLLAFGSDIGTRKNHVIHQYNVASGMNLILCIWQRAHAYL